MPSHFSSGASGPPSAYALEAEFQHLRRRRRGLGRLQLWLRQLGPALLSFLTGQSSLSIRTRVLASGVRQWTVYDPTTDTRYVFDSQQAVRAWLEQRYYR